MKNPLEQLLNSITTGFDLSEIQTFCFYLSIDYEELKGETKTNKVISLLNTLAYQNRIPDLIALVHKENPAISWPEIDWANPELFSVINGNLPPQQIRLRQQVIKSVREIWIQGVLKRGLNELLPFDYAIGKRIEDYEFGWEINYQYQDSSSMEENRKSMLDLFENSNRTLVILGSPGSGKTIALLKLAKALLNLAERNYLEPLPIVLNLSSWIPEDKTFLTWLNYEMNTQYQVGKDITTKLIQDQMLILLLDGLDEVKEKNRESCIREINRFRAEHTLGVTICSRQNEYENLPVNANFRHTYVIQPFSLIQIKNYLDRLGVHFEFIQKVSEIDQVFSQLLHTPFMLDILAKSFGSLDLGKMNPNHSLPELRHILFDAYIDEVFQNRSSKYKEEQVISQLAILAFLMDRAKQTIFSVRRISERWVLDVEFKHLSSMLAIVFGGHFLLGPIFIASMVLSGGLLAPLVATTGAALGLKFLGDKVDNRFTRSNLVRNKVLPKTEEELTEILDFSVEQGLLRKVGDEWIFAHQSLLQYFASKVEVDEKGNPVAW